jgi:xanthine dehydrogenase large subunit
MSVGKTIHHDSSHTHVTGESIFIDDRRALSNEVLVGVVGSPIACGKIKKIKLDSALKVPGVLGIFQASDFYQNHWGTIVSEQPILAFEKIGYRDEPVLAIAATTEAAIGIAKKLIEFEYVEEAAILSIDEAIEKNSFITKSTPFIQGDADDAIKKAPHKLSGIFECGGQEHFYLESQATIVYPLDGGMLEVHSSSQHPTETQHVVAHALGLDFSKVSCIVKRMGGGFGGKESQAAHFAAIAGLVAYKLNRPARLVLTKDDDMMMTGKRHPFKNYYEVGFNDLGLILGIKAKLFANGGAYTDLTPSILDRAMFHLDNCYYFENCLIEGFALRTNQHSNTAFRGFGGPQGAMTIESIIEDIAKSLGIDALSVREINLYQKEIKNKTPYNQILENNVLPELFEKLKKTSNYELRRKEIEAFNKTEKTKVRGLSLTGCKFGIAFTAKHLNQGNALVNLHLDGTVQVSTGATEMGQGVNTKIKQIVAHSLGLNSDHVIVMATSTEKNHNTSPTAASSGADINGAAAKLAADQIRDRLKWVAHHIFNKIEFNSLVDIPEYADGVFDLSHYELIDAKVRDVNSKKELTIQEVIKTAYFNRISLGGYAFYKTPNLGFDKKLLTGRAFNYFTNGAAVTEVEIDEFTGELKVLRTDILMDLGRSINPGIDEGQVSGAFVQSMGWVTTENLFYNNQGKLLSHSPTTYKIPNIQDTPRIFKIDFLENNENSVNVHRSKAVGEPPFLLGVSVWTAIKNAIGYRRSDHVNLLSPATHERILMELNRD